MLDNICNKLFCDGEWILAISDDKNAITKILNGNRMHMDIISGNIYSWYADPFLIKNSGRYYIFAEEYDKKKCKGSIAVAEYKNDKCLNFRKIIENTYHMSYPCVFAKKNKYYMIPETSENNTIEIYECIEFPYIWVKKKNLLNNVFAVDVTYFYDEQNDYLISYNGKNEVTKYKLDCDTWEVQIKDKVYVPTNIGRGAGNIIKYSNNFFRPIQDCRHLYGEKVCINEIVKNSKDLFLEREFCEFDCSKIILNLNVNGKRIHTINICDEKLIVDLRVDSYSFRNFINKLYKKIMVSKRKLGQKGMNRL